MMGKHSKRLDKRDAVKDNKYIIHYKIIIIAIVNIMYLII